MAEALATGMLEMPTNPTTEKLYRGGNALHLMAVGMARGYDDPRWMTYRQADDSGWHIRKGEKGAQIDTGNFRSGARLHAKMRQIFHRGSRSR